jgi:hypothetical protein
MRPVTEASALPTALGLAVGLSLLVLLAPGRAAAQSPLAPQVINNQAEEETPRSAAMGGAMRAMGAGTTALFLNPATLPETRVYHIEALTEVTPETRRWVLGGAVVDSVTSRLVGGFAFSGTPIAMDPNGIDRSFLDARLALAFPISEHFLIGLLGHYLRVTQSGLGPFGFSQVSGGLLSGDGNYPPGRTAMVNSLTFDAGIVVRPTDNLYIAALGQNLTYPKNSLLPTTVGGGIGYGGTAFSIELDGIADLNSWGKPTARLGAGAEYLAGGVVPIRAGFRFDEGAKISETASPAGFSTLSLGLGYVSTAFSIEAAVKRTLSNPGATSVVFSAAYFLESSGMTHATGPNQDSNP